VRRLFGICVSTLGLAAMSPSPPLSAPPPIAAPPVAAPPAAQQCLTADRDRSYADDLKVCDAALAEPAAKTDARLRTRLLIARSEALGGSIARAKPRRPRTTPSN